MVNILKPAFEKINCILIIVLMTRSGRGGWSEIWLYGPSRSQSGGFGLRLGYIYTNIYTINCFRVGVLEIYLHI